MVFTDGRHVQKDNISSCFFHFIQVVIFQIVRRVKEQKMVKVRKKTLSATLHISGTIHFHLCIYSTYDNISRNFFFFFFFHFIKILIFQIFRGVIKRTKNSPQKLCLLHFIFKEPCIIWLSFVVHKCKLMISPRLFFFFKTLIFQ